MLPEEIKAYAQIILTRLNPIFDEVHVRQMVLADFGEHNFQTHMDQLLLHTCELAKNWYYYSKYCIRTGELTPSGRKGYKKFDGLLIIDELIHFILEYKKIRVTPSVIKEVEKRDYIGVYLKNNSSHPNPTQFVLASDFSTPAKNYVKGINNQLEKNCKDKVNCSKFKLMYYKDFILQEIEKRLYTMGISEDKMIQLRRSAPLLYRDVYLTSEDIIILIQNFKLKKQGIID